MINLAVSNNEESLEINQLPPVRVKKYGVPVTVHELPEEINSNPYLKFQLNQRVQILLQSKDPEFVKIAKSEDFPYSLLKIKDFAVILLVPKFKGGRIGGGHFGNVKYAFLLEPDKKKKLIVNPHHLFAMKIQKSEKPSHIECARTECQILTFLYSFMAASVEVKNKNKRLPLEYRNKKEFFANQQDQRTCHYLLEPYFEGESLAVFLTKHPKLCIADRFQIALNLMVTMNALHTTYGIIHKDIKAQNLIINPSTYEMSFCDFGLSKFSSDQSVYDHGTPYYKAPEIVEKTHDDEKGDIFALATVLAEIFGGDFRMINWLKKQCKESSLAMSRAVRAFQSILPEIEAQHPLFEMKQDLIKLFKEMDRPYDHRIKSASAVIEKLENIRVRYDKTCLEMAEAEYIKELKKPKNFF